MKPLRKIRRTVRRVKRAGRAELTAAWRRAPVRGNVVLYESFSGNGALCNPEAIFRYLVDHPEFAHLRHVWAVDHPQATSGLIGEFTGHPRVRFIKHRSQKYSREIATAGYLVNNATFPTEFSKREGQVYVNTWHGTPLKRMGYAMPNGAVNARNIIRNFLAADYLLSSSPFMTEQMYATDYRLRNVFRGRIIEEGLPRTDREFGTAARDEAVRLLTAGGLAVAGRRVLVYAPTWKGPSFYRPEDSSADVAAAVHAMQEALGPEWIVLAKTHQVVYEAASRSGNLAGALVPNEIPANLVLAATDVLATDYSSIFFDFLPLDRPIVFHIPDRAEYEGTRGLYREPAELPGEKSETLGQLAESVSRIAAGDDRYCADRAEWRSTYAPYDDGGVTERVVDVVFRGSTGHRQVDISTDGRPKLLVYLGTMKSNGITTSGLNLMANLDHEVFDVSAFYLPSFKPDRAKNIAAIHPAVRHLPWIGGMNGSKILHAQRDRLQKRGISRGVPSPDRLPAVQLFAEEWRRCFGTAEFDHVVDFSGYGPLWPMILLQGKARSHSIWLHNDMHADARREVHGERHLYEKLHAVFTTYRFFDHLVSVSQVLAGVNARMLAEYAHPEAFTYAHNTIDYRRIRELAATGYEVPEDEVTVTAGLDDESDDQPDDDTPGETGGGESWVWQPRPDLTSFVTVGRLSTEKNHERLIRAFAQVHAEHPATRLIILGDGPLAAHLAGVIADLGLGDSVELAGFQRNPFHAMAGCDCFVLSSDHEGQPMVILEALTLGLPVVITDFSSSAGALPAGTGLVVERSVAGLAGGMLRFLAGTVPAPPFDPEQYNRTAMSEFYRAIGADYGER